MNKLRIAPGDEFGRLTVVRRDPKSPYRVTWYECKCSCGNPDIVSVRSSSLACGNTQSCGCLRTEVARRMCRVRKGKLRGSVSAKAMWASDDGQAYF